MTYADVAPDSHALLRGKHAEIDEVGGKHNVADCLTKHLNVDDTKAHLLKTGFQKFDTPFVLVKLERINQIGGLQSSDPPAPSKPDGRWGGPGGRRQAV